MANEPSTQAIRSRARAAREAGTALRALPLPERARAIAAAAQLLLDSGSALGRELRSALLASSGLSSAVIEHGLSTTLGLFEAEALCALHAERPAAPAAACTAVVLAGNVWSAAARPLLLPLLCGSPVCAKASTADDALPRILPRALAEVAPELAAACASFSFDRGDPGALDALLEPAEVVSIYGSDASIDAIRPRLPAGARLIAHGHGFGLAVIAREALADPAAARTLAERFALDVAAYDQRGCLSPHALFVEAGGALEARAFARLLADALQALEARFPRGPLDPRTAAAQLQWRGVSAAIGELHATPTFAVCHAGTTPLRPSPGLRNIAVHDAPALDALRTQLDALGPQLKALALAGPRARQAQGGLAPYTCELGSMQTPPLDARLDGLHPLEGF